jgi:hypothetical protein
MKKNKEEPPLKGGKNGRSKQNKGKKERKLIVIDYNYYMTS